MKFIADAMLGRLAKRLRLMGYDVLYDASLDDNAVIRLSLAEERIILTRDRELANRPLASRNLLIDSDEIEAQIRQVLAAFPALPQPHPFTRCSVCNSPLETAPPETVKDLVPSFVLEHKDCYLQCPGCGRVYWKGTHVQRMEKREAKKKPASG